MTRLMQNSYPLDEKVK